MEYIREFDDEKRRREEEERKKRERLDRAGIFIESGVNIKNFITGNIERYYSGSDPGDKVYTYADIGIILTRCVVPYMKSGRQFFSICKGLMHKGYIAPHDFNGAYVFLSKCFDKFPFSFDMKEITALDVSSMYKDVPDWEASHNEVKQAYPIYYTVAIRTIDCLPDKRQLANELD